ncbi:hypothetical protein N2152v2_010629 [Parachlorella kessleri]
MSFPNRFGRELLGFAKRSGAPRKWSQDVRKSVSDGIQLCGAILADLEKQDWQQLEQDFEVLFNILEHACADSADTGHFCKPALDGWVYDELIVPVLRSAAAPRTKTLLACFDVIVEEEKELEFKVAGLIFVKVGETLLNYIEEMMAARKDFGSDLADTMLTAFKQHLLFLQEAELNLEAAAFPDHVGEKLMTTWVCQESAVERSEELAELLAALAEAHPSLAAYLRSRGLQQKAESWRTRLPDAKEPLGRLLTALARLPAADSNNEQQEGGSKGLKACAVCGSAPSANSAAEGGDGTAQVLYGIMNQGYGDDINLPRMSAIEPWLYEELIIPVLRSGEIRLVQESADPSSTAAAEEEHRLRWLFGAKCGLLQTLLASFEVITNEEQDSDYLLPFDLLTSVGWSLVPYVEARGQYADELALAFIKAFQAHPLYLQTAELSLDSVASSHAVHQEQLTECCEGCNTKHSQQLARVLAALAEAHPSLAGYLRSRGLRVKADSWHARLPGAQEPLSRLLKAFSALPATGSGLELPRQGSKGAKSCALCGAVRSSCGSSSGGSSSSEGQHSASSVLAALMAPSSKQQGESYHM